MKVVKAILLAYFWLEVAVVFFVALFVALRYHYARMDTLTKPPFFVTPTPRKRPRLLNCPDYPSCSYPECDCYERRR